MPSPFSGTGHENAQDWLNYFSRFAYFKQLDDRAAVSLFALLMRDTANTWYMSLPDDVRQNYATLTARFKEKYAPAPISMWRRASEFWSRDQRPQESVDEFYSDMMRKARDFNATDDMARYAIMRGLKPELRTYVMQQNPTSTAALLDAAKVAEATVVDTGSLVNSEILEAITRLERQVANNVNDNRRVTFNPSPLTVYPRSPTLPRRDERRGNVNGVRSPPYNQRGPPPRRANSPGRTLGTPQQLRQQTFMQPPMSSAQRLPRPPATPGCIVSCRNCGRNHAIGACFARGKNCNNCGKPNHFAVSCRSRQQRE